jgi:hypothetical protein
LIVGIEALHLVLPANPAVTLLALFKTKKPGGICPPAPHAPTMFMLARVSDKQRIVTIGLASVAGL